MKKTVLAAVAAACLALGLAGCGEIEGLFSPNAATNAASIKQLTASGAAIVCDISALTNVAANVETAAQANASITGTTSKVLAASTAACTGLGAIAAGTVTVPAGTSVIQ
jgi:predicted small lipoprotein YifL